MTIFLADIYKDKDGNCEIKDIVVATLAATNNQQVIAAVAGKRILVLSGTLSPAGAAGAALFKSATGGTNKHGYNFAANPANEKIDAQDFGVFSTNTGEGLFVDNTSVAALTISLRYIEWTPF